MLPTSATSLLLPGQARHGANGKAGTAPDAAGAPFSELLTQTADAAANPAAAIETAFAAAPGSVVPGKKEPLPLPSAAKAATPGGKVLPVLPATEEGDGRNQLSGEAPVIITEGTSETTAAEPPMAPAGIAPVVPEPVTLQLEVGSKAAAALRQHPVPAPLTIPQGVAAQAPGARTPAVSLTVSVQPESAQPLAVIPETLPGEPVSVVPPKTPRTAEAAALRTETLPALQTVSGTAFTAAQPVQPAFPSPVTTASQPLHAPTDIAAVLDQLTTAREALLPAEAALAIHHDEFGEVSIRFEQSREGHLSVELTGADPELPRAVAAATGAERATAESDTGRSSHSGQRGPAVGSDASPEGGTLSRNGRELDRRHGGAQPQTHQPAEPHNGIFA